MEKMISEFCDELESKERQISELREQLFKAEEADDAQTAAAVLIDARRTADIIIAEARMAARTEQVLIEHETVKSREELDSINARILALRMETARCLANMEEQIGKIELTQGVMQVD